MIQIIIFSFNRAMQLNTLLCSMTRQIEFRDYKVDILYNVSSDIFAQGYNKLIKDNILNEHIHFIKEKTVPKPLVLLDIIHASSKSEMKYLLKSLIKKRNKTNFRKILLDLLKDNKSSNVMFLTDDACFINQTVISDEILAWINEEPYHRQFSLRTGKGMNEEPQGIKSVGNYLEWNYYKYPFFTLWGYPFSVDAHIYNKNAIIDLLSNCYFDNPNSLEGNASLCTQKKNHFGTGRAFTATRLLSFPINMVQQICNNDSLDISLEMLNEYYLKGYHLEYPMPNVITTFQVYPDSLNLKHSSDGSIILSTKRA